MRLSSLVQALLSRVIFPPCPRGGMVDTGDLKSPGRKAVPVQVRPRVPGALRGGPAEALCGADAAPTGGRSRADGAQTGRSAGAGHGAGHGAGQAARGALARRKSRARVLPAGCASGRNLCTNGTSAPFSFQLSLKTACFRGSACDNAAGTSFAVISGRPRAVNVMRRVFQGDHCVGGRK